MGSLIDHIFLFLYIITVGFTFAVLSLSLLYWMRKKSAGRFSTFFFIAYLALLLIIAGIRFYWKELLGGGRGVTIGTGLAEFAGYALLLYFIPATLNHIIGRSWTPLRLSAAITAGAVYFILGTVYMFTGFLKPISLASGLLFILALGIILLDIVRGISLIERGTIRATVLFITLLTVAFLPLAMVGRLLDNQADNRNVDFSIYFLFHSLYYFLMALIGIMFYVREMANDIPIIIQNTSITRDLPLTHRELEIADSVANGLTYNEIADTLGISPNTVRNHVANTYKKLSIRSKLELTRVLRGESVF